MYTRSQAAHEAFQSRQSAQVPRAGGLWIGGVYAGWVLVHYLAANAYARICTPATIYGFIASPFVTTTPPCSALRWAITTGAEAIGGMWCAAGSLILLKSGLHTFRRCGVPDKSS